MPSFSDLPGMKAFLLLLFFLADTAFLPALVSQSLTRPHRLRTIESRSAHV
jgi:hypothetical protein